MPLGNANDRGAWAVGTTYAANDVVTFENRKFVAVAASTGVDPSGDDGTHWTEFATEPPPGSVLGNSVITKVVPVDETAYAAHCGEFVMPSVTGTVTLPAPVEAGVVEVYSNGASITCTVHVPSGIGLNGTADGTTTVTTQFTKKTFRSDGTGWFWV